MNLNTSTQFFLEGQKTIYFLNKVDNFLPRKISAKKESKFRPITELRRLTVEEQLIINCWSMSSQGNTDNDSCLSATMTDHMELLNAQQIVFRCTGWQGRPLLKNGGGIQLVLEDSRQNELLVHDRQARSFHLDKEERNVKNALIIDIGTVSQIFTRKKFCTKESTVIFYLLFGWQKCAGLPPFWL
jgi:hypothetical protein